MGLRFYDVLPNLNHSITVSQYSTVVLTVVRVIYVPRVARLRLVVPSNRETRLVKSYTVIVHQI